MNNFVKRTVVGIIYLAVMIFGIIWDRAIFIGLFLLVMYQALNEFYTITLASRFKLQQKIAFFVAVTSFLAVAVTMMYASSYPVLCFLPVIGLLSIPVTILFGSREELPDLGLIYAGLLYVAAPFLLYPVLVTDGNVFDGTILLSLFIIIWLSDIGAYCLGTLFGQKENSAKLAPSISPKKSWVGFWSGVVIGTGTAIGLHYLHWLDFSIIHCISIGILVTVGGVCGDLFESVWKRHYHVKDSGNCIPGHGGMLDRFDSSLIAIPLASAYLILFELI